MSAAMPMTERAGWQDPIVWFVRYQSVEPNARGTHPGVFALANGLARTGQLSDEDLAWWRTGNRALDLAYLDPATIDPTVFDRTAHARVSCCFKESSAHLLEAVSGYTALLDRYAVPWMRLRTDEPGVVLYEDDDQVVVAPLTAG